MLSSETIAALATPPGEGGVAIIRISGTRSLEVAEKIFSGPVRKYQTHTAHFGKILDEKGQVVDEVLILPMLAPKSYTGEDTIEIHCHGGSLISRRVLDTVLRAGARPALPGEFTQRAFLNGKLDLAQAEAVQELIGARNELALHAAGQQLQGALSAHIQSYQKQLVDIAANLEAWVDFPEEDLEFASLDEIAATLEKIREQMQKLDSTFHEGKIIQEGLTLCLIGAPNVGKSSLMNALLGKERAIVTAIPGTTRDFLEEEMRLSGLHFRLIDTAGIRETDEPIEQEGIRRSKQAMERADLILLVLDASRALSEEDHHLIASAPPHRTLLIRNKMDLAPASPEQGIPVSAKLGWGLDALREAIDQTIWRNGPPSKEEVLITNVRHKQALSAAILSCTHLIDGLKTNVSPEFLSSDMRATLSELGTIIGSDITEDILSAIFSKFCVGK
jgi:tRNA modification GTPase